MVCVKPRCKGIQRPLPSGRGLFCPQCGRQLAAPLGPLVLRGLSAKQTGGVLERYGRLLLTFNPCILPQSKIKDFCRFPQNEGAEGAHPPKRHKKALPFEDTPGWPLLPLRGNSPPGAPVRTLGRERCEGSGMMRWISEKRTSSPNPTSLRSATLPKGEGFAAPQIRRQFHGGSG